MLFRIGIYRIPGHEGTVTVTTVGVEVVLIVMLEDLEEVELPLSVLVVHTLRFGFRNTRSENFLNFNPLNPCSSHVFNYSESRSFQGKTTNKRESEKQTYAASFSSTSGVSNHHQIPHRFAHFIFLV